MGRYDPFTPPTTAEDEHAALLEAQRYLHSVGVTGWHDAIVGSYFGASDTALITFDEVEIPAEHLEQIEAICPAPWKQPDPIRG